LKKWKLFLLLAIIVVLSTTISFLAYEFYSVIEVRTLNISLDIVGGAVIGMSGDTDKLDFGAISNGNTVEKGALVENYRKEPVRIVVVVSGNVSPFIEVSENNFMLEGNGSRRLKLIARPVDAELGHYSGTAFFYFKRT